MEDSGAWVEMSWKAKLAAFVASDGDMFMRHVFFEEDGVMEVFMEPSQGDKLMSITIWDEREKSLMQIKWSKNYIAQKS